MNKNSSNPTVSILLPVYNGQAYLQEMLESIASQNLTDFELIVVDDGSTDGSWDLLTSWMSGHALRPAIAQAGQFGRMRGTR